MTPLICSRCHALHGPHLERCVRDGQRLVPALPDPWLGAVLAKRYWIEGVVADGKRSRVYAARCLSSDRRLALKVLRAEHARSPEQTTSFLRELELSRHVRHPSVLELVDTGVTAGLPYLVAERVAGPSLAELIAHDGALPPARTSLLFAQLCAALAAMHTAGVVHRRLDVGRVLLDGPQRALLSGLAGGSRRCRSGTAHTQPMPALRPTTPPPPGTFEERDLFALGLVLQAMLVGDPRPQAPSHTYSPRLDPDQPLAAVCLRLTSTDPARRYRSIFDLLNEVGARDSATLR